jgi:hypothetical protein
MVHLSLITQDYLQVSIGIRNGGGFYPFHGSFGEFSGTVTVGAFEPLAFLVSGEPGNHGAVYDTWCGEKKGHWLPSNFRGGFPWSECSKQKEHRLKC